jgi:hypothetical protein
MQGEVTIYRLTTFPLKGWIVQTFGNNINKPKILSWKKLRADGSQGMLAIIRCSIFRLPVCYPKNIKIKIHGTIILPVVLYERETWSVTLREERRLRV